MSLDRAHRTIDVLERLKEEKFVLSFIPANCTSELKPLDDSVNSLYKSYLKEEFILLEWQMQL
jgi:hypothetical protein